MSTKNNTLKSSETPFWDWMMNLGIVKWFCNLGISKAVMKLKVAQALFNYEMITYLLYGVLTTIVNAAVFFSFHYLVFLEMGMGETLSSLISNAVAWVIAMLFAFITNKLIVFRSKDMSAAVFFKELIAFALARLATFGISELILLLSGLIGVIAAFIIAQVIVVISNYILSKLFIFKNKDTKKSKECA